jgi:uncharacterized protein (TIGR02588 family)
MIAKKNKRPAKNYPEDIPPLEWATAGLGLALLIGFLTLILHNAIAGPKGPPDIHITVRAIHPTQSGHLVQFEAKNVGGTTATTFALEGQLRKGGRTVETATAEIDHLPPGGSRTGGMFFRQDPKQADLELSAKSFQDP